MININNTNKKYNDILYDSRPVQVSELVSDKNNAVHAELFNDALLKFVSSRNWPLSYLYENYKVIELKNDEYWKPSSIIILSRMYNNETHSFTKEKIDLTSYWNSELSFKNKTHTTLKIAKDDNINDYELIDINYVTGTATLKSKLTGNTIDVDFDHIDDDIKVSDDFSLTNTFSYMYQNR